MQQPNQIVTKLHVDFKDSFYSLKRKIEYALQQLRNQRKIKLETVKLTRSSKKSVTSKQRICWRYNKIPVNLFLENH